ncbi:MAG: DUF2189 domain-containing protein [Rhodospirillales bacterium]
MAEDKASFAAGSQLPFADRINRVRGEDPFKWLAAGWRDFHRARRVSLAYGLIVIVVGIVLTVGLYLEHLEYLIAPLTAGFLLVGPALTVGFYAISRDLEAGQRPSLRRALLAWRANPGPLLGLGLGLVLFLIVWIRLAVLTFALTFPYEQLDPQSLVNAVLFTADGNVFLILGTMIGCVMAGIAFATGAFSLPLLLDRKAGLVEAISTSVVGVLLNARVMALWAAIIVVSTAAGILTLYIGLAVSLPLIGHASWHAYRAVVRPGG